MKHIYHSLIRITILSALLFSFLSDLSAQSKPVIGTIPGETVAEGGSFSTVNLNNYVTDADQPAGELTWFTYGNVNLNVTIDASNTATISPVDVNWSGTEIINFVVTGSDGLSDTAHISFTVTPVNDPPVIDSQNPVATDEDTPVTLKLADLNVTDVDNSYPADFTLSVSTGTNYSVSGNTITPAADYYGTLTVPVTVNDGAANSSSFDLSVTVNPVNDPPVINGQNTVATDEDTPVTLTLADLNVTDVDNSYPADFTLSVSTGTNYSVSGNTITPATNYYGTLTVPVTVNDGAANSSSFDLSVTVNPVNDPPVINGQNTVATDEDTPVTLTLADLNVTDVDNSYPADFTLSVSTGTNYSVSGNTITPAADYYGTLTVPVTVNDGAANSSSFDLSVTVNPVNDPPVINGNLMWTIAIPLISLSEHRKLFCLREYHHTG